MELVQANAHFVAEIEAANEDELLAIWVRMQTEAFISYKINLSEIDKNAADFEALSLADKKRFMLETLDKNMLYVPYCDMEGKEFGMSAAERAATHAFYNLKNKA